MAYLSALWRGGGDVNLSPGYRLQFPYDLKVIAALKATIPLKHREWNEETKTWWVQEGYEAELGELFTNFRALAFDQVRMNI